MEKINKILNDEKYKEYLYKIKKFEEKRIFCKHDLGHFLDMSRIAYIMVLEKKLNFSKEVIYAIGLLHDIGRWMEYEKGVDHHKASVELSKNILINCDFSEAEIDLILKAIAAHRVKNSEILNEIIYKSDKLSRNCMECAAREECNWSDDKKNLNISY